MRTGLLPFILCVATLCACASSENAPDTEAAIPLRTDCTRDEAVELDANTFLHDAELYVGQCVHVRGVIADRNFYADLPALYVPQYEQHYDVTYGESYTPLLIGVYGPDEKFPDLWSMRENVEVVAYAYSCEDWHRYTEFLIDREREEAIARGEEPPFYLNFMAGTCHYYDVPVLYVTEMEVLKDLPNRLTGEAAALSYGNLMAMTDDWKFAREVRHIVNSTVSFIREKDAEGLVAASAREPSPAPDGLAWPVWPEDAQMLVGDASPYSSVFHSDDEPEIKFFHLKNTPTENSDQYIAYGCVCKEPDCEELWPISDIDALEYPSAPYLCFGVERRAIYDGNDIVEGYELRFQYERD